jgi:hypothetical protein
VEFAVPNSLVISATAYFLVLFEDAGAIVGRQS